MGSNNAKDLWDLTSAKSESFSTRTELQPGGLPTVMLSRSRRSRSTSWGSYKARPHGKNSVRFLRIQSDQNLGFSDGKIRAHVQKLIQPFLWHRPAQLLRHVPRHDDIKVIRWQTPCKRYQLCVLHRFASCCFILLKFKQITGSEAGNQAWICFMNEAF